MFTFQTTGRINGMTPSRDGKIIYLKIVSDAISGVDLHKDEQVASLDVACAVDLLPPGSSIGTRVGIEGTGAISGREWRPPAAPNSRAKTIFNTRLQVRTMKLAK